MHKILKRLAGWSQGLALAVSFFSAAQAAEHQLVWDKIERGILYTRLEVDDLVEGQRMWIHVYSVDTSQYALRLFDYRDLSANGPLSFDEWYRETRASVLFNVCMEGPSRNLRGFFKVAGTTVQERMYNGWKGVLVMGPEDGSLPATRIIDMNFASFDSSPSYRDVIQQPMLLDEDGNLRVSPRDYTATRVALGEDVNHNALMFLTEDSCTLWEMARWLQNSPFELTRAINLGSGNAPQVLGRFPPERIYIVGEDMQKEHELTRGSILRDLSSSLRLSCVLGVEPIPR